MDDEIAMLRAKKNVVVVSRLRGQIDYDKAKALEADLDAAIADKQVGMEPSPSTAE